MDGHGYNQPLAAFLFQYPQLMGVNLLPIGEPKRLIIGRKSHIAIEYIRSFSDHTQLAVGFWLLANQGAWPKANGKRPIA